MSEESATYKPRERRGPGTEPHGPQRRPALPTPALWACSPHSGEAGGFCG